jgi:hypothetical protein
MKAFFFVRKKQEAFGPLSRAHRQAADRAHKFFGCFFQKRTFLLLLISTPALAQYQIPGQDPNWPCAQRLVTTLEAGSYWNGTVPQNTPWRDNDALFSLVPMIVDRDTPNDDAVAKLKAYVATIPAAQRAAALPALFSAIVDQTNDERALLIKRLLQLGRRQRAMGDAIGVLSTKIDALPTDDPKRVDAAGERDLDVRALKETQLTMRYACEAPANMERRLGVFARVLQAK